MRKLFLSLLLAHFALAGQNECGSDPEARAALHVWEVSSDTSTFAEQRRSIDELSAKYAGSFEIQMQRISFYRFNSPDDWPGVREGYAKRAQQNPNDPLSLTVAAAALYRKDTPRAIAMLSKVREASPDFSVAALKLAEIYSSGKFEDKGKARTNFNAYAAACAEHLSRSAEWVMTKVVDTQTQAAIAQRLRARLDAEHSPNPEDYKVLWSLEFRARPPAEHAEIRKRVAKDVERLVASNPDKASMEILLTGVKQSGAGRDQIAGFEDRVIKQFPRSEIAYEITSDRWDRDHKQPDDPKNTAAWEEWKAAHRAALKQWVLQFSEVSRLGDTYAYERVEADKLNEVESVAAIEKSLQKQLLYDGPSGYPGIVISRTSC